MGALHTPVLQNSPSPHDDVTSPSRAAVPPSPRKRRPHEGIATLLDVDPKTLRRHYRQELDRGAAEATAKVAQSLFQMATVEKNVAAAIFWMKARAGWREKHDLTITARSACKMTDAELE